MRILLGVCACTLLFISVLIHAQTGSAGSTNPGSASSIANDSRIQLQPGGIEILSDTQGVDFNYWLKESANGDTASLEAADPQRGRRR